MNNIYINPEFPLENSLGCFDDIKTIGSEAMCEQLDENKTVYDILQLYFYSQQEKISKEEEMKKNDE